MLHWATLSLPGCRPTASAPGTTNPTRDSRSEGRVLAEGQRHGGGFVRNQHVIHCDGATLPLEKVEILCAAANNTSYPSHWIVPPNVASPTVRQRVDDHLPPARASYREPTLERMA